MVSCKDPWCSTIAFQYRRKTIMNSHANKILKTNQIDRDLTTCFFAYRPQVNVVLPLFNWRGKFVIWIQFKRCNLKNFKQNLEK